MSAITDKRGRNATAKENSADAPAVNDFIVRLIHLRDAEDLLVGVIPSIGDAFDFFFNTDYRGAPNFQK